MYISQIPERRMDYEPAGFELRESCNLAGLYNISAYPMTA